MSPLVRSVLVRSVVLVLALAVVSATPVVAVRTAPSAQATNPGIAALNELRALSGLPPVSENASMTDGARRHSEYMVRTGTMTHFEDPSSRWYSAQGDVAARQSNLAVFGSTGVTAEQAVDALMVAPFHGIAFVDPALSTSGAALFSDAAAGRYRTGFTINVNGGRTTPAPSSFPVTWPGNRSTVNHLSYKGGEYPDPVRTCGYSTPSGLPLLLLFAEDRRVDRARLTDDAGTSLDVCAYDRTTYTNPDGTAQEVGRQALASRNAIVVIPRAPLTAGRRYHAEVNTSGGTVAWSFATSGATASGPIEPVDRVAGNDRIATAVEISRSTFPLAPAVVLARADAYADALAGAPLARKLGGPVLLTGKDGLHASVAAELRRLAAVRVVLLGGRAALGTKVEADLRQAGVVVIDRIDGADRFEVAAAIAEEVGGKRAFVVEGANPDPRRGWPDALSAGAVAAQLGQPVLFVTRDQLPRATARALEGRDAVTVVGGSVAVSDQVMAAVGKRVSKVTRVSGPDRYATSVRLIETLGAAARDRVWLATGRNWPDALAAGPAVAAKGRPLVLIDGLDPWGAGATYEWLRGGAGEVDGAVVVGGKSVVSEEVAWTVGSVISTK